VYCWPLVLLLGLLPAAGCGGKSLPPLSPVKGKVTLKDGQPLTGGQVTFVPEVPDKDSKIGLPGGPIGSTGEYEIFTEGQRGAPSGKYKVTINPGMVPQQGAKGPPKLPFDSKYQRLEATPLRAEVPGGSFDFKLDPPK